MLLAWLLVLLGLMSLWVQLATHEQAKPLRWDFMDCLMHVYTGMQAGLSFVPRLERPPRFLELERRHRMLPRSRCQEFQFFATACLRQTCVPLNSHRVEAPDKSWMQRMPQRPACCPSRFTHDWDEAAIRAGSTGLASCLTSGKSERLRSS